jgi:hypothetical protein
MYFGSFDQAMADAFIKHHLFNPDEFWTPMPLTSIAANDPAFRNIAGNNWSGQPQGLTFQRTISALENYGHFAEVKFVGKKLFDAVSQTYRFTQQFDPFTTRPNNSGDGYGPTILSVLEFMKRMYGIHVVRDAIWWSNISDACGDTNEYTQVIGRDSFVLKSQNGTVTGLVNGQTKFSSTCGVRIVTDRKGNLLKVIGISSEKLNSKIKVGKTTYAATVVPNGVYIPKGSRLILETAVPFYSPPN